MKKMALSILASLVLAAVCMADTATTGPAEVTAAVIEKKLDAIILPAIEFRQSQAADVIAFLNKAAKENDADKKGVEIVMTGNLDNIPDITFVAKRLPLRQVLTMIAKLSKTEMAIDKGKVVLSQKEQ